MMKVLVIGSTGGSGRAAVEYLLRGGHEVTAFSRAPNHPQPTTERLRPMQGDAMEPSDVLRAVKGQDAVIVTLGISENPLIVRLRGPAHTPMNVRSAGTRNAISAMRTHGVRKLVVQTSYGVGDTRLRLGYLDALFLGLVLKPQIADTEEQNRMVSESGLDWVIVQPVHLTDDLSDDMPHVSVDGETARMKVSRRSVGRFLAAAAATDLYVGETVAISGAPAKAARTAAASV